MSEPRQEPNTITITITINLGSSTVNDDVKVEIARHIEAEINTALTHRMYSGDE